MNRDQINLCEAYSRIHLKIDEDFRDQVEPELGERIESVYGEEIPPLEGEDETPSESADPDIATFDTHNIESIYNAVKGGMSLEDFSHWVKSVQTSSVDDHPVQEKKEKFSINTPTQAQIVSKTRAPIHKPTKEIKPKKGIYNRQDFKRNYD